MIVFYDTCVHIELLRGAIAPDFLESYVSGKVRLSPVVASELLRGARGRAKRSVDQIIADLVPLEPKSWRSAWLETGTLLPKIFPDHESVGLSRLQNDCMIALTARDTGAVLLTLDAHFESIAEHLPFTWKRITP
ncbi:MAG: PIN domain-containing protein [Polyangiaceae bacterium]|nr:PIN domain-containing protein [Polyangiaceae bacterium]